MLSATCTSVVDLQVADDLRAALRADPVALAEAPHAHREVVAGPQHHVLRFREAHDAELLIAQLRELPLLLPLDPGQCLRDAVSKSRELGRRHPPERLRLPVEPEGLPLLGLERRLRGRQPLLQLRAGGRLLRDGGRLLRDGGHLVPQGLDVRPPRLLEGRHVLPDRVDVVATVVAQVGACAAAGAAAAGVAGPRGPLALRVTGLARAGWAVQPL
mmetsp:Transcript_90397/g.256237  ORF Transcript_90397/g.256237 Transcript_90397/m.256237 type:complete len:215 (-) Transcript_90397:399-1043(-)